jgi:secreted PhoX family phosphatase
MNRRSFLKSAAAAAAAVPLNGLLARAEALSQSGSVRALRTGGYGPLVETLDEATGLSLLKLPEGFRYVSFGWAGDLMADGQQTPGKHDGGDFTGSEWSGPCYSPDGQWLFANIFDPGITVAITGPWQSGAI